MSEDRAAEGLEHLQRAGMELIAAARLFLDLAEEVVADRDKVAEVVSFVSTVAEAATDAVAGAARPGGPSSDQPSTPGARVEHIDVS